MADTYERLGQYPEAIEHYLQATKLEPDLPVPYLSLGNIYLNAGDFRKAVEYYDQGLKLDPADRLKRKAARDAAFRLLQGNASPDSQTIGSVLGGSELSRMGPAGVRPDRRLALPIAFETGSDEIAPQSGPTVRALGASPKEILANSGSAAFVVEGHTDSRGGDAANLELSRRRARRVAETLVKEFGLPAVGSSRPARK